MSQYSPYQPPPAFEPMQPVPQPRRRVWPTILTILGISVLVPIVCCGGAGVFLYRGLTSVLAERGNIELVIGSYMQEMEAKNAAVAYRYLSPLGQQNTSLAQMQGLLEEPDYALFSDYKSASVTHIQGHSTPFQKRATVQGTIAYEGGISGTFRANLQQFGDTWAIDGIHINVPPAKVAAKPAK
jgi:hypothetical protein